MPHRHPRSSVPTLVSFGAAVLFTGAVVGGCAGAQGAGPRAAAAARSGGEAPNAITPPGGDAKPVTASRFILVNDEGKKIAELSALAGEPILIMRGPEGENKIWIQVSQGVPKIIFFGRGGKQRVIQGEPSDRVAAAGPGVRPGSNGKRREDLIGLWEGRGVAAGKSAVAQQDDAQVLPSLANMRFHLKLKRDGTFGNVDESSPSIAGKGTWRVRNGALILSYTEMGGDPCNPPRLERLGVVARSKGTALVEAVHKYGVDVIYRRLGP